MVQDGEKGVGSMSHAMRERERERERERRERETYCALHGSFFY